MKERKKRTAYDKARAIEMIKAGISLEEIAEELGIAKATVLKLQQDNGLSFIRKNNRYEAIKEYRRSGHSVKETAEYFGVSTSTVYQASKGEKFAPIVPKNRQYYKGNQYTALDEDVKIERFVNKYLRGTDFEYVSGYKDCEHPVLIRCKKCGETFERSMVSIRHSAPVCFNCMEAKSEVLKREKREQRLIEIREKKARRHEEAVRRKKEARALYLKQREHPCARCGKITTRPKYCCDACSIKANTAAHYATHEASRRMHIRANLVDRDITIEKLYERDHGICWICGMMCDWSDKTVTDKGVVVGKLYPSVEHVIPITKGGKHSWKNVKLAHWYCNVLKGDKSPVSEKVS